VESVISSMIKAMKINNKNIGSERVASALGTVNDLGLLCEQSGIPEPEVIDRMNQKIMYAEEYLRIIYDAFEKDLVLGQPLFYGREVEFICGIHPINYILFSKLIISDTIFPLATF
jgi:hypothetical protein